MSSYGREFRATLAAASKDQASLMTRALGLRILSGVVQRTPVDTGRARANWQVSLGRGSSGEVDAEDKAGSSTIAAGNSVIAQQRGLTAITLENNLPYIGKLEDGSSAQAPEGMTALTLAALGLNATRTS